MEGDAIASRVEMNDPTPTEYALAPSSPPQAPPHCHTTSESALTASIRIEERLRTIEANSMAIQTQLTATQDMIRMLTQLVLGQERTAEQASVSATDAALGTTRNSIPAGGGESVGSTTAAPNPHPLRSRGRPEVMTRMISTKDIIDRDGHSGDTPSSLSLASAVSLVRRLARVASAKTFHLADTIAPTMTRRFSVRSLALNAAKPDDERLDDTRVRRFARWSKDLFHRTRVQPIVTKTQILAARLEGGPTHRFTIRHDASGRIAWDVFVMAMVLCDVVLTPLSLSFHCCTQLLAVVNAVATGVFAADMVVHALSSYTTKRGTIVSGPENTIPHYCFSVWALADFLSCFPFEYFVSTGRFLSGAKVIRLVKISQLMYRFHSARKAGAFRLVRLISVVLLVSHGLTCYWNWIAQAWRLHEEGYLHKPVVEQYVHSWSTVIGSLNASPPAMFTPLEELSVAFFMLIGNVLQASVFGSVAALIQSFDEGEVAYNKKLVVTYERCKMLDIPELLTKRINSYYQHLHRETRSVDPDADAFINELSPALVCEVKFQLYRDMVKQIPFFSSASINPVLIEMLILRLRTVIYMQDDMLIRKGEFADWMGFIGSKGTVGVLDPNSETHKILRILYKGEYFGETGLLHRTKRTTTAVALSWVQIHVLTRGDLDQVKEQYAEDAESLEQEIRLYMKSRVFSLREGQVWDESGDT